MRILSPGVIQDLPFPESSSVNGLTDTECICTPEFQRCDAIGTEILQQPEQYSDAEILLQAGDVTQPFEITRVNLFGGRLFLDNTLVIDSAAAFGWFGPSDNYGVIGGAIATYTVTQTALTWPQGPFNYYWLDDHINVAVNVGTKSSDVE
ncbi:LOW QUALITY PROTEIN: hypothetical protein PHMEG_00018726 [Phytophthora megakarya]|uniref:Uncharacterized protein n=1 Tax=Phytophthora megakarya TaxID=4795 RepID=A0A225VV60_9STRA|nr:LOW QUALITY PROTEIN: hypothetical protein PHMEG_00018726 [Phytophthora megakarya]